MAETMANIGTVMLAVPLIVVLVIAAVVVARVVYESWRGGDWGTLAVLGAIVWIFVGLSLVGVSSVVKHNALLQKHQDTQVELNGQ